MTSGGKAWPQLPAVPLQEVNQLAQGHQRALGQPGFSPRARVPAILSSPPARLSQ